MHLHRGDEVVTLGSLTSTVVDGAEWCAETYPAWPEWPPVADEAERLFAFAESRGVFEMYLPKLITGQSRQRDAALGELRVAFYFHRNDFRIAEWCPSGEGSTKGEFTLECPTGEAIFVEVKTLGWESEVSQEARVAGRTTQPKYVSGEGLVIANDQALKSAVERAYPKFSSSRRNLLVVLDDLFLPMRYLTDTWARAALYRPSQGKFTTTSHQRLGGVGCFWRNEFRGEVWYDMPLFVNPNALPSCALPDVFALAFHGRVLTAG